VAAGDLVGIALFHKVSGALFLIGLPSVPLTAVALKYAGADAAAAFTASSVGFVTGMGLGSLLFLGTDNPLVVFPAAMVYYGVRLGVTIATARLWERSRDR